MRLRRHRQGWNWAPQTTVLPAFFDGVPATILAVYQAPGANALAVSENVLAEMERLSADFPEDVSYAVPFNTTGFR